MWIDSSDGETLVNLDKIDVIQIAQDEYEADMWNLYYNSGLQFSVHVEHFDSKDAALARKNFVYGLIKNEIICSSNRSLGGDI